MLSSAETCAVFHFPYALIVKIILFVMIHDIKRFCIAISNWLFHHGEHNDLNFDSAVRRNIPYVSQDSIRLIV